MQKHTAASIASCVHAYTRAGQTRGASRGPSLLPAHAHTEGIPQQNVGSVGKEEGEVWMDAL